MYRNWAETWCGSIAKNNTLSSNTSSEVQWLYCVNCSSSLLILTSKTLSDASKQTKLTDRLWNSPIEDKNHSPNESPATLERSPGDSGSLSDRWKWAQLKEGNTFCVWSQSRTKAVTQLPHHHHHHLMCPVARGQDGSDGDDFLLTVAARAPATTNVRHHHPTMRSAPKKQTNLDLFHTCRKQSEQKATCR